MSLVNWDRELAEQDARKTGTGFLVDGKHVAPSSVTVITERQPVEGVECGGCAPPVYVYAQPAESGLREWCQRVAMPILEAAAGDASVSMAAGDAMRELRRMLTTPPESGGQGEGAKRAAGLLDDMAWQVHPASMSHDDAGSLWVWAQDAAGLLRSLAVTHPPAQASGAKEPEHG